MRNPLFFSFVTAVAVWMAASGAIGVNAQTATTTALAMSSVGGSLQSGGALVSGGVLTLNAAVTTGSGTVTRGPVNFCDATAAQCTDVHIVGSAQLTSAGTAVLKFRPGPGSHSYKVVFGGTHLYATSSSASQSLTVTTGGGQFPAAALLSRTGSWGQYSLSATVEDLGGTSPLTGGISIQDTSNGGAVLADAQLGPSTPGVYWATQTPCTNAVGSNFIAVGDFNGDGYADFATIEASLNEIFMFDYQPSLGCYEQTGSYSIGSGTGIYLADFNGDGIPDIAVPSGTTNSISILLGNGDGTFRVSSLSTPSVNTYIATADFSGDGIPDLAVASIPGNTVSIYLGNGDGTFTASPTLSATSPWSIATGDFNGDGKVDLAAVIGTAVEIFLGNGDGTFKIGTSVPVQTAGSTWAEQVVAADLNGDGKPDLAVSIGINQVPTPGSVAVFLGNGDGTFKAVSAPSATPNMPVRLAVADFNLDGIPDVAALDIAGSVTVMIGKGDGTFASPTLSATSAITTYFQSFAVGDMDGDGRLDFLFAGSYPPNRIVVYFQLTKPMETASTAPIPITLGGVGQHLVTASYSGDATSVPATSSPVTLVGIPPTSATTLTVTAGGAPATTVTPGTVVQLTAGAKVSSTPLTAGVVNFCDATANVCDDIHLIGSAELQTNGSAVFKYTPGPGSHSYKAVLQQNAGGLSSSSNTVNLTVSAPAKVVYPTTATIAQSGSVNNYTLAATLTETGSSTAPTGTVSFLDTSYANSVVATAPLGAGTSGLFWQNPQSPAAGTGPWAEATADFNGDGIPDLAVTNLGNNQLTILLGNGDGTFRTLSSSPSVSNYPEAIVAGDFNGDGKPDLAVAGSSSLTITILLGNGDGTFTTSTLPQISGTTPESLAVGDFNADGKLDLVAANYDGNTFTVFLGNGDGTFTALSNCPTQNTQSYSVAVGDFNGDKIPDLVVSNNFGSPVAVYMGNGDGSFTQVSNPTVGSVSYIGYGPVSMVVGDFNGDGLLDVAAAAENNAEVQTLLGKGDGTFTVGATVPVGSYPSSIATADFNQDGKADLVVANYYGDTISTVLGNGDGTFTRAAISSAAGYAPYALVAADFNGDGIPDVAAADNGSNIVTVLITQPTQTATAIASGVSPTGSAPHLVDASYPGDSNYRASVSGTTSLSAQAATPVIIQPSGTYTSLTSITITEASPGAIIYYSGTGALASIGTVQYTGPIPIYQNGQGTIQAYATGTGYQQSGSVTATYTSNMPVAPAPTFSVPSGNYPGPQTVSIAGVPGTTILYSTNGVPASLYSTPYSGPISVTTSGVISAIAAGGGYAASSPALAQYYIDSAASSFIYTVAGTENVDYLGDGGGATLASLDEPAGTAVDSAGNLYIADYGNSVVRKVAAGTGIITTVAGTGIAGYSGDGGPATSAQLNFPMSVALDSVGNLYISDYLNNVIREVAASTGTITTIAGSPTATLLGDGGAATSASLGLVRGIAVDTSGNLYIATLPARVRKVASGTGIITTFAGTGSPAYFGNGSPAANAGLNNPNAVAVDAAGNLYIADSGNNMIRKVAAGTGIITTVAGVASNGSPIGGYSGDGGQATSSALFDPYGVAVDGQGNLFIADTSNYAVREVTAATGIIKTIGGVVQNCTTLSGDGGPANDAGICEPIGVSLDSAGNVYVTEQNANRIRKITATALPPTTTGAAPSFSVQGGTYAGTQTLTITDSTPGAEIYIAFGNRPPNTSGPGYRGPIQITAGATIQAIAVAPGYLPSSVTSATYTILTPPTALISTAAQAPVGSSVFYPYDVAVDSGGNLYIPDYYNEVVWKKAAGSGTLSIVAGTLNSFCLTQFGVAATSTCIRYPEHIAVDANGNLYITEPTYGLVLKLSAQTGLLSIYAGGGTSYTPPYGDGGPATSAYLSEPEGLTLDSAGNLYIADESHGLIRKVSATSGTISTVAGSSTGTASVLGDGGPATSADLYSPYVVAVDSNGDLYIGDIGHARVRMVNAGTGVISTIAGNGLRGNTGDGGPGASAEILPEGIAVDGAGNVYISSYPDVVRKVSTGSGTISTAVGNGYPGYSGDGGAAAMAEISSPQGLAFDNSGNLYIAVFGNQSIREVTFPGPAPAPTFSVPAGTYTSIQTVTISDSVSGATIYYTTDGTIPTPGSTVYGSPITVSTGQTIQAIAVAAGYTVSAVRSATYKLQLTPAITWATPAAILYGTTLSSAQLNATASAPGTFVYAPAAGTVLDAGIQTLSVTFTPTDSTNYVGATSTTKLTVNQATPTINWATPAAIPFGTALSSTQLNATASVPGAFVYSPAAGTIPAIGTVTLSVVFTPTDAANYKTVNATVVLSVVQGTSMLNSLSPAIENAGGSAFALTVNGAGFTAASVAYWGSSALTTQYVNGIQLTAQVPSAYIAKAGTYSITVQTPAPSGSTSNTLAFEVDTAGSTPPVFGAPSATVPRGSSASYPVTLPSSATNVSVSCLNLPAGSTCSYSSSAGTVTIATNSTTPGGTYQITVVFTETLPGASAAFVLPLFGLPLVIAGRRRKLRSAWLTLCMLAVLSIAAIGIGCGGGGGTIGGGTSQQTHQATSSAVVTLIVQ